MPFTLPTFDALFNAILTDYLNQNGSVSAETRLRAACLASALWGAYKHQDYIARQIHPDTADTANLEHHFWTRTGGVRNAGETDAELLVRLHEHLRKPPAGGNKYDYIRWAKECANVANAWCFPIAQGPGTVDVVFVSDEGETGSEVPSTSARTGQTTSAAANKLYDTAAAFTSGHAVAIGDLVENPLRDTETTVTAVDGAGELTLADDLFLYAGETYLIHMHTGETTDAAEDTLIDSAGAFTNATYTIKQGDLVRNLTDSTETTVVSVTDAGHIALADDIFTAAGKQYVIEGQVATVKKYIDTKRPVTASTVQVLGPTIALSNITMGVAGTVNRTQIAADIEAYMNGLAPAETSYLAQRIAIAITAGGTNALETVPNADIVPSGYEMIRPGTITIT